MSSLEPPKPKVDESWKRVARDFAGTQVLPQTLVHTNKLSILIGVSIAVVAVGNLRFGGAYMGRSIRVLIINSPFPFTAFGSHGNTTHERPISLPLFGTQAHLRGFRNVPSRSSSNAC
jgi:hypothetical protein